MRALGRHQNAVGRDVDGGAEGHAAADEGVEWVVSLAWRCLVVLALTGTCLCCYLQPSSELLKDRFDNIVMRKMAVPVKRGEKYVNVGVPSRRTCFCFHFLWSCFGNRKRKRVRVLHT